MQKNLVMYFPLKDVSYPLLHPYQELINAQARQETLLECFPKCVSIYIARGTGCFLGNEIFIPQFKKKGKSWIPNTHPIQADLVLGFSLPDGVKNVFNTMHTLTRNKQTIEQLFPEITLPSKLCLNYKEICEKFHTISTKLKVLKPRDGTRSRGIFITEHVPNEYEFEASHFPYILQEFFDTSGGFYEFPGMHDFRIILLNGKIIGKFLRQPAIGKYTANSFRNGRFIDLKDWKLPHEISQIVNQVESYCATRFPHRYYSIDIGQGPHGEIKIFEMNSAPGLTNDTISKELGNYIAKNILKVA